MRPWTCLAALLLPLALTSCGDTDPNQPTYEMEIGTDQPSASTPPPGGPTREDLSTSSEAAATFDDEEPIIEGQPPQSTQDYLRDSQASTTEERSELPGDASIAPGTFTQLMIPRK